MKFKKNEIRNTQTRKALIDYYSNINMQTFKWKNLPDTCSVWYLERSLFYNGSACIYKRNDKQYLSLKWQPGGEINIYGEYTRGIAIGENQTFNGNSWTNFGDNDNLDIIPCFDNKMRTKTSRLIDLMVDKLSQLYRTQDILIEQSKRPAILSVPEHKRIDIINLLESIDTNTSWIVGTEELGQMTSQIEVLPLPNNLPNISHITQEIITIDNLIRKYMGVYNNENSNKKERLVVDEINSNNAITDTFLYNRLESRQEFCELVNKYFGLNISVELSDNIKGDEKNANNQNENIQGMEKDEQPVQ